MSKLTEEQMLDVMAYADGELAAEDEARVRVLVETNAEAKELLASMRAIGDGVRSIAKPVGVDVANLVMLALKPNDFDKARIKRTARIRMAVVSAGIVALAAGVALYVRSNGDTQAQNHAPSATPAPSDSNALASLHVTGVEVDSVDTPSSVSVFYIPGDNPKNAPGVVVWIDDTPETP